MRAGDLASLPYMLTEAFLQAVVKLSGNAGNGVSPTIFEQECSSLSQMALMVDRHCPLET